MNPKEERFCEYCEHYDENADECELHDDFDEIDAGDCEEYSEAY